MSKPLVYLAGPISGLSYGESVDWRDEAKHILADYGIHALSPMRAKHYLSTAKAIADEYPQHVLSNSRGITTRDRFDTQRASLVLVNLLGAERVSIGTMLEVAWADAARVPIVAAIEEEGNIHDHAMVRELVGFRLPTLSEAYAVVVAILGGEA